MTATLVAKDLEYARNDLQLFSGLNFELGPGDVLQIEGRNGSGKTTLLRILCGLIQADKGQILWCGQDIQEDRFDYSINTSYIGHHDGLKGDCTPLENLALSLALSAAEKNLSPHDALEKVGLKGFDHQLCRTLSAGQRRRVALARLLISPTRLWILDEPFTAIDQKGIGELEQMIADHAKSGGMVILTSHHTINLPGVDFKTLIVGQNL